MLTPSGECGNDGILSDFIYIVACLVEDLGRQFVIAQGGAAVKNRGRTNPLQRIDVPNQTLYLPLRVVTSISSWLIYSWTSILSISSLRNAFPQ